MQPVERPTPSATQSPSFALDGEVAKQTLVGIDGKTYTVIITFKGGMTEAQKQQELRKYDGKVVTAIVNMAVAMKLGEPKSTKQRTLTRLHFDVDGDQQVRMTKEYRATGSPMATSTKLITPTYYAERIGTASAEKKGKYKQRKILLDTIASIWPHPGISQRAAASQVQVVPTAGKRLRKGFQASAATPAAGVASSSEGNFVLPLKPDKKGSAPTATGTTSPLHAPAARATGRLICKTAIEELQPGKLNPFKIDYAGRSSQKQAAEIFDYLSQVVSKYPNEKVAITYSANSAQADDIYAATKEGKLPKITGGNQAEVFKFLLEMVDKSPWKGKLHVLPIPTCLQAGGAKLSTHDDVERALDNIKQHLAGGYIVLGLQNQNCTEGSPLAIGGGIATVWNGSEQKKLVDREVRRMLGEFQSSARSKSAKG
jgi:hypothetical protein